MYRKNARNPPYLFTTERAIYGKAGATCPLRNVTWQCQPYDGGGTRNILDPSPSKPCENYTQSMLGMQKISPYFLYNSSGWTITGGQNHTWCSVWGDRSRFCWANEVPEILQSRREVLLRDICLQLVKSCSLRTVAEPWNQYLHRVFETIYRSARTTTLSLFR
jgi:hypothetical protein